MISGPKPMPIPHDIRLQLGTMPYRCLTAQSGVSVTTIARWRSGLGIPAHAGHEKTRRYLALLAAHPNGLLTVQISRALGVTRQAVHQILQRLEEKGDITRQIGPPRAPWTRKAIRWRIHTGERTV